jgi:multimeric flavodoxin WrbA
MSIKVQVILASMYGHVYRMAEAVVEGAKQVSGAEVSRYQVAELVPDDVLEKYRATCSIRPARCGSKVRSSAESAACWPPQDGG